MYGKIFESIFDSTLAADGGWLPTYVFMSMVVLADKDGLVDVAPKALYRRLGFRDYDSKIEYKDFLNAINYLERIDTESRSSLESGRRIIPSAKLDDIDGNRGWLIVNYQQYRNLASREDRAKQSTDRSRRWRGRNSNKNNDETEGDASGRKGRHTDTDTDIKNNGRFATAFDLFWSGYPKKRKKKTARDIWKRKKLDRIANQLITDVNNRLIRDKRWLDGFVPDPTTYLNGERWNDELESELTYKPRQPEVVTEEQRQLDRDKADQHLAELASR